MSTRLNLRQYSGRPQRSAPIEDLYIPELAEQEDIDFIVDCDLIAEHKTLLAQFKNTTVSGIRTKIPALEANEINNIPYRTTRSRKRY